MQDFPGNSHTARTITNSQDAEKAEENASDPKKLEKVITGKVVQRKKGLGSRFKEMFFHEDGNFGEYLFEKVIVPKLKDLGLSVLDQFFDGIHQGVEEMFHGPNGQGRRKTISYGTPRRNYNAYSASSPSVRRESITRPPGVPRIIRRSNVIEDIILETREDGEAVIEELTAVIDSVGHCTVGDLYSLVDIHPKTTDEGWGWTDISNARCTRIPGANPPEFMLRMPSPRPIEN